LVPIGLMERTTTLLGELNRYRPADALEGAHHRAIIELLSGKADPFSRNTFRPGHITASCFIIEPESRRILLHHHRRLNRWLQMGGHVEADESPLQAAFREGAEESGLNDLELVVPGLIDVDVHFIPAGKGEPDHSHFDVRYLARTAEPDSIRIDRNESNELAWVDLDRAIPLMNEEASSRVIHKIDAVLAGRSPQACRS
jgi:8-oxo-dGTP pyrophosphatase MutT (NUDIX family)